MSTQRVQGVLLFLVLAVNSALFQCYVVTHSYSSRLFLCALELAYSTKVNQYNQGNHSPVKTVFYSVHGNGSLGTGLMLEMWEPGNGAHARDVEDRAVMCLCCFHSNMLGVLAGTFSDVLSVTTGKSFSKKCCALGSTFLRGMPLIAIAPCSRLVF